MQKRVVIYCRVSSVQEGRQSFERQIVELTEYAKQHDYQLVKVFAEKVSGAKSNDQRPALMQMIEFVKSNNINKVISLEASRIGRSLLDCLTIIQTLTEHKVSLLIVNNNLETLDEKGEVNPITQMVLNIMFSFCSMERQLIYERTKSGYNQFRANGGKVGRKEGFRKSDEAMKEQYLEDIKLLKKGYSLRNIQKITSTSLNTLQKIKKLI